MNRAADHYDEFYLWQTIKLAGNGSRLLAPRLRQGLDHRVITILFLPEDDVKRALNQLSLMLQQPLTANDNPPVIATMKAIDRNVEGILLAPQRLGRHYPAGRNGSDSKAYPVPNADIVGATFFASRAIPMAA